MSDLAPAARPAVRTYLPTPADAPVVTIHDDRADESWYGVTHLGVIHDASGVLDPRDIGVRYRITTGGVGAEDTDVTAEYAPCCVDDDGDYAYGHADDCENYDGAPCCADPGCPGRGSGPCTFPGYAADH